MNRPRNLRNAAIIGAAAVGTGIAAVATAPMLLSAVGFGSAGVAAGSIAATIQSMIGNVAAGGIFATLQRFGAVGIPRPIIAGIGVGAGAVGGQVAENIVRNNDVLEEENDSENEDDDNM